MIQNSKSPLRCPVVWSGTAVMSLPGAARRRSASGMVGWSLQRRPRARFGVHSGILILQRLRGNKDTSRCVASRIFSAGSSARMRVRVSRSLPTMRAPLLLTADAVQRALFAARCTFSPTDRTWVCVESLHPSDGVPYPACSAAHIKDHSGAGAARFHLAREAHHVARRCSGPNIKFHPGAPRR